MKKQELSNLELQIMSVLWEKSEATAREVLESLSDGKKRAYTTVLSMMQVMTKKGILKRRLEGTTHVYRPASKKESVVGGVVKKWVKLMFGGSHVSAMQHLINESDLNKNEIDQIKKMLAEYEERAGQGREGK